MLDYDDSQDFIKNHGIKEIPAGTNPTNKPNGNLPFRNLPDSAIHYNEQYDQHQMTEKSLSEDLISKNKKTLIEEQSIPMEIPQVKKQHVRNQSRENDEHQIFLYKRFYRDQDVDVNGKLVNGMVSGTVLSRYTVSQNSLDYVKVDHLTEYDETAHTKRDSKLETMIVRFASLDQKTQSEIRSKLPSVNRKVSEEGLDFMMSWLDKFHDQPYNSESGNTYEEMPGDKKCRWIIGYGHHIQKDENNLLEEKIDKSKGRELFHQDISNLSRELQKVINVFLQQQEFDALVSFAAIHGIQSRAVQTLLHLINTRKTKEAAYYLQKMGLPAGRGKAEAQLFEKGQYDNKK